MSEFAELFDLLSHFEGTAFEPADLQRRLQDVRPQLVNPLKYPGPKPESRKQVESRRIATSLFGEVPIDAEPDQRIILQLSQELHLDEVACTELLFRANEERGMLTAEAAAGIYFEDRMGAVKVLERLLALLAFNTLGEEASDSNQYVRIIKDYVMGLVSELQDGRCVLLQRLSTLLQDTSLDPLPHSSLPQVLDRGGHLVPRSTFLAIEKEYLARSLLYVAFLNPVQHSEVVNGLLDLVHFLAGRIKSAGGHTCC